MRTRTILLLVFICVPAFAQEKQAPPEGGPPKIFHLAQTQDFTLPNGMKVTLAPYGVVPKVAVRAYVNAGGIDETANQVWLSRLTALLMKEGTKTRTAQQVADGAADDGGQLEIEAGAEYTVVGGSVLTDRAIDFVQLIADVLQNPALPASEIARLKADLARELAVSKTQPQSLARERFLATMFPNSPYGRVFPSERELQTYSAADTQAFYSSNFGAKRTHLYVAGNLPPGLADAIKTAFAGWGEGPSAVPISAAPVKAHSFSLIDRPGAPQSTIYMGLPVADPTTADYIRLNVMDSLLGGSFASRITSNIREQKGYTYSPFSQISTRRHVAYWIESADVTTAVTGPSLKEITYEINRLRKDPPSPEELKGIQNYLAGLFVLRNTISSDAVISQIHFVDSQGLNRSYLSEYVQKVEAVTPQDVQGMTEKYLDPAKMSIVIVGDKTKIADQVRPYETVKQ